MAENNNILPDLRNEQLVATMNALKENENKDTQSAFVTEALKAKYFAPVDILNPDGTVLEGEGKMEIPKDAKFNFKLIVNNKGEQFFPIFTDISEFQKWNKDQKIKTIVVVLPQMASLAEKKDNEVKGIVINPMSQNLVFTNEILANLLQHIRDNMINKAPAPEGGTPEENKITLYFGKPKNIPDSVIASLSKNLAKNPEVNKAYFLMMKQGEQEHYLFVLDIDADNDKSKKIADSLCSTARLFLSKFPVIAAPLKSVYGQNADKVVEPFYVKE